MRGTIGKTSSWPVELFIRKLSIYQNATSNLILQDDDFARKLVWLLELLAIQRKQYHRRSKEIVTMSLHARRYFKFIEHDLEFEDLEFLENWLAQNRHLPAPHPGKPFTLAVERQWSTRKKFFRGVCRLLRGKKLKSGNIAKKKNRRGGRTKALGSRHQASNSALVATLGVKADCIIGAVEFMRYYELSKTSIKTRETKEITAIIIILIEIFYGVSHERLYYYGINSEGEAGTIAPNTITHNFGNIYTSQMGRLQGDEKVDWPLVSPLPEVIDELIRRHPYVGTFEELFTLISKNKKISFGTIYMDTIRRMLAQQKISKDISLGGFHHVYRYVATVMLDYSLPELSFVSGNVHAMTRGEISYYSEDKDRLLKRIEEIHLKIKQMAKI